MVLQQAKLKTFPRQWQFLMSVPKLDLLPMALCSEVAFCGRSNVGKSSLINALVQQKNLARTSNTPGRTQELNFFRPNPSTNTVPFYMVDMPGYGYAVAPKQLIKSWQELIFSYLRGRSTLQRVYILIDSRHGIKKIDEDVLDMLDMAPVSYQIILTKIDKIAEKSRSMVLQNSLAKITRRPAAFPEIIATSSEKLLGINELQQQILSLVK